ncbi:MAG: hypothetical protein P4L46_06965 [Fimbriimonas sp.]|nr:hypothetical protein [Fimbriimonas sp.]
MISAGLMLLANLSSKTMNLPPKPDLERTCFQTSQPYSDRLDLRADVAIVYGIGKDMPSRVDSWRNRGYRVHLMTGVAWGEYQDYLYGRFDGINHEDEAQTNRQGDKIGHGGDVYYMSPGIGYGKYLSIGVQRALDAGVEAIHLEEPEFWSAAGYSGGFKREWQAHYNEPWQPQHESVDARWRSSKLKYFLYRRALQQVFDYVQAYNRKNNKSVRCYVPTHSLINYASWGIVSPESSLARLDGCDGYIAQVWTGTSRTPNVYRGKKEERTFETAFLEYGAMMNLVRSTGRRVWFLADPVEDNPDHDWGDYKRNWEATLTASLLHPDVADYEIMPWPERIYTGSYPSSEDHSKRVPVPEKYATELANVTHALKSLGNYSVKSRSGTKGVGVMVSDSLMFERGDPNGSDQDLSHIFGLALPFVMAGVPIEPVQLESVVLPHYLDRYKLIYMTYRGQKPQSADVHGPIADWVRKGGTLVFVDDDGDPFNHVREWWNDEGKNSVIPRQKLFQTLGIEDSVDRATVGRGRVVFVHKDPTAIAYDPQGPEQLIAIAKEVLGRAWRPETGLTVKRGPYMICGGGGKPEFLEAIDLFDPDLRVLTSAAQNDPGHFLIDQRANLCHFLVDLRAYPKDKARFIAGPDLRDEKIEGHSWSGTFEGQAGVKAVAILRMPSPPKMMRVEGRQLRDAEYRSADKLLWIRFPMTAKPQRVELVY